MLYFKNNEVLFLIGSVDALRDFDSIEIDPDDRIALCDSCLRKLRGYNALVYFNVDEINLLSISAEHSLDVHLSTGEPVPQVLMELCGKFVDYFSKDSVSDLPE